MQVLFGFHLDYSRLCRVCMQLETCLKFFSCYLLFQIKHPKLRSIKQQKNNLLLLLTLMVQRVDQANQGDSYLGSHVCHQLWLRLESTLKTSSLGYQSVDWDFSRNTYMKFFHIDCTHCGSQVARFSVPKLTGQMEAISFYDLALEIMQHNFHYILSVRVNKISEGNQTPPFDRRQRFCRHILNQHIFFIWTLFLQVVGLVISLK